ncbi:MAG: hypothetical protein IKB60_02395 [Clostridia bacterium]|nr:hypothetical protein [Clostridia bacterium]
MKKALSLVLVVTMLASMINISFAENKTDISIFDTGNIDKIISLTENIVGLKEIESFPFKKESMPMYATTDLKREEPETFKSVKRSNSSSYSLNQSLLTSFNTVTGPIAENGANEPKFSYNRFLEENISDYSGELTLNFEDLVLDGRNGLDLTIGRTYQTVASNVGEKTVVILPNNNGYLQNRLININSTYLLDRYNLGVGWGFSFPSVQVETEYIPKEVADTYYYDEETELYYHSGNGDVYQVEFTSDTTDSNLKGYYNKDIQFNAGDTGYSNGQISSYYSMTLSDKTKQYFAEDGRLIGIVDRFGNTIKFEHELKSVANRVPQGTFAFIENEELGFAEDMWISSVASDNTHDAVRMDDDFEDSNDGHYMYFRRNNENGDTYILSRPIQINPMANYDFGMRFKNPNGREVTVSIIGYDTAYNHKETETIRITDYATNNWVDINEPFSMKSSVRYIQIKISPKSAQGMCIDTVTLDEPKPLIDKITDSVGRTIEFDYEGDINSALTEGAVNITVTSPDGSASKVLQYNKSSMLFDTEYMGYGEQKKFWYLQSSNTEGNDGKAVSYTYYGGATINENGEYVFPALYSNYISRTAGQNDSWANKLALNSVKYRTDRRSMSMKLSAKI